MSLLRLFRTTQTRSWSHPRPHVHRGFCQSSVSRSDTAPEPPSLEEFERDEELAAREEELAEAMEQEVSAEDNESSQGASGSANSDSTYRTFMAEVARPFKHSGPRLWLGQQYPFPMNKSFTPPPPISDAQRNEMYTHYMADPETNSVRALSQRYHVSLKRVDAILRLKGMESAWVKGKPLQTGFVKGMERILAVPSFATSENGPDLERHDAHEADTQEEIENRDAARQRYQRMYWELLPESGGNPIVPASLEQGQKAAKLMAQKTLMWKNKTYLPKIPDTDTVKTPKDPIQISTRDGRPDIRFVDVGTKFLDVVEETRRLHRIEQRARHRSKKVEEKQKVLH